jgi:Spy/CpxP family protein refolding chaperone
MEKLRALDTQATKGIHAVLTAAQNAAVPALLKLLEVLPMEGVPVDTFVELHLADAQKQSLTAIGQRAQQAMRNAMESARNGGDPSTARGAMQAILRTTDDQARAVLTADQRAAIEEYMDAHAGQGPGGGFGGPPRPPGGGFDGGPGNGNSGPPQPPGGANSNEDGGPPPPDPLTSAVPGAAKESENVAKPQATLESFKAEIESLQAPRVAWREIAWKSCLL